MDVLSSNELESARELYGNGRVKQALLKLIKLSTTHSNNLEYLYLLADVQKALGETKNQFKTIRVIQSLSTKMSDKIEFLKMCIFVGEFKELNSMLSTIDHSLLTASEQKQVLDLELEIAIHYGDVEKIYSCQRRFEGLGFTSARYYYSLALINLKNSAETEALENLRLSLKLDPKMDTSWTALALLHHKLGDIELALANLQKALDSNPYNQTALKLFSSWSYDQQRILKAESYLNFYLDRYSFDESIIMNKISLLERNGFEAAAKCEYLKLQLYFG